VRDVNRLKKDLCIYPGIWLPAQNIRAPGSRAPRLVYQTGSKMSAAEGMFILPAHFNCSSGPKSSARRDALIAIEHQVSSLVFSPRSLCIRSRSNGLTPEYLKLMLLPINPLKNILLPSRIRI